MPGEGFKSFDSLLKYLYGLRRLGIKAGLEHTRRLLSACGNPDRNLNIIHIAGTNGKGSVSANIASILKHAGYHTGIYTSPHLVHFNERIRIDGEPISDRNIVRFVSNYKTEIDRIEATFFETTTALALWYFKEKSADVCIVETGLGGRLDSTNVIAPGLTVITPVDMDHMEYLGDTLSEIAGEKAGIIKNNIPVVLAPQAAEARAVILETSEQKNAAVFEIQDRDIQDIHISPEGTTFQFRGERFKTPLIGYHQALNASLAVDAVRAYDGRVEPEIIRQGLKRVVWPGRLQLMQKDPPVFYDVAHNPRGIEAILSTLEGMEYKKLAGVIALKGDKDLNTMAEKIRDRFKVLYSVSETGLDLIDTEDLAGELEKRGVTCIPGGNSAAVFATLKNQISEECPGLIFGSHYIGKAVFQAFDFSFDKGRI